VRHLIDCEPCVANLRTTRSNDKLDLPVGNRSYLNHFISCHVDFLGGPGRRYFTGQARTRTRRRDLA
jgi:hypothetical protein